MSGPYILESLKFAIERSLDPIYRRWNPALHGWVHTSAPTFELFVILDLQGWEYYLKTSITWKLARSIQGASDLEVITSRLVEDLAPWWMIQALGSVPSKKG